MGGYAKMSMYGVSVDPLTLCYNCTDGWPRAVTPQELKKWLQEVGDAWLDCYGGLVACKLLPQPIWEAIEEWL